MIDKPHAPIELDHPLDYDDLPLGSRHRFSLRVASMADGSWLKIPILVQVGSTRTPRLVCVAGVHGNEHEGVTALLEMWEELASRQFDGTLVMVPVANPPAFRAHQRKNPADTMDMNRAFPGKVDGNTTEQLAYHLFHGVLPGADLVLSMHGWTDKALVIPYTEYPRASPVTEASLRAARAFGLEYIEAFEWPYGLLGAALGRAGIPAIEPEIGGLGHTIPDRRVLYKRGIDNLTKYLGMQPGQPETPPAVHHVQRTNIYAPSGGVLRWQTELGKRLVRGDLLFSIVDLTAGEIGSLEAPSDGFLALQQLCASVDPGDLVAVLFQTVD
jgi:predicted deacylase